MAGQEDMDDGAAEALRFVLLCLDGGAQDGVTYTLSGAAGGALVNQVIILLRMLAERETPAGEDPDEFARRYLGALVEEHTLRALGEEFTASGGAAAGTT